MDEGSINLGFNGIHSNAVMIAEGNRSFVRIVSEVCKLNEAREQLLLFRALRATSLAVHEIEQMTDVEVEAAVSAELSISEVAWRGFAES